MVLFVNGTSIGITHMARDFVLVESPIEHRPVEASILLKVDDSESKWNVFLPEGMSHTSNRVALSLTR